MSVRLRPAGPADWDAVADFLHRHMNARFAPERWRRVLDHPWRPPGADSGRMAVDGGRIVGFLGLIQVDRPVAGAIRRFANLTSWYLLKEYRGRGLGRALLRSATDDPAVCFTNLTPAGATVAMVRAAGFAVLDDTRFLFRRAPGAGAGGAILDPAAVRRALDDAGRRIVDDHAGLPVRHAVVPGAGHVAFQVKRKGADRLYHEVMGVADPAAFAGAAQALADAVLPPGEDAVLAVDARFLGGAAPAGAAAEPIALPRLARPAGLPAPAIDALYSEIPLLDLKLP